MNLNGSDAGVVEPPYICSRAEAPRYRSARRILQLTLARTLPVNGCAPTNLQLGARRILADGTATAAAVVRRQATRITRRERTDDPGRWTHTLACRSGRRSRSRGRVPVSSIRRCRHEALESNPRAGCALRVRSTSCDSSCRSRRRPSGSRGSRFPFAAPLRSGLRRFERRVALFAPRFGSSRGCNAHATQSARSPGFRARTPSSVRHRSRPASPRDRPSRGTASRSRHPASFHRSSPRRCRRPSRRSPAWPTALRRPAD